MQNIKVSLIIPVYNSKPYLVGCLNSIQEQDYRNIEIILIDDGSDDGSEEIMARFSSLHENCVLIHQKNKGVGAARNLGLREATGDYISFIDSDDIISPNYCSHLVDIIGINDIAIAGRSKYVNDVFVKSKTAEALITISSIEAIRYLLIGKLNTRPAWGKLYRRELLEGLFFAENLIFEELRFSVDSFVKSESIIFSDKDLYSYKIRPGSIMTSNLERHITDMTAALEYIYNVLIEEDLYKYCQEEFKIWLTGVIVYNTNNYVNNDVDSKLFKDAQKILLQLFYRLVPNGRALFHSNL